MSNLLVQANIKRKLAGRNNKESEYNYKLYVHSLKHKGDEKKYYNDLLKASLNSNSIKKSPKIYDNDNKLVEFHVEKPEKDLAYLYVKKNDTVLELGARFGSVSCIVNNVLENKKNHVVVEPDDRVWEKLEYNKSINDCEFEIVKGFLSNKKLSLFNTDDRDGYGSTFEENEETNIPSFTLDEVKEKSSINNFNVLIADCEGFLEIFFDENPSILNNLRLVIFEEDYPDKCDYEKIRNLLKENGLKQNLKGHQNVWIK